jgi:flagellin-like hook-associated protein FlgL
MTTSISSIPTTRLSDLLIRGLLLNQLQSNQAALLQAQTQLSTGQRYQLPSEDPLSALRAISIQSLLERKAQVQSNIKTNQSYLSIADTALSSASDLMTEARALAVGMTGSTASDAEINAAIQQIDQILQELLSIGNQQYLGRYLFAGSQSAGTPFQITGNGYVQYSGNETDLSSYADVNQLFQTNFNGNEVFGTISSAVQGSVTITPALTYDTALDDLRQGQGISKGSIKISDGANYSIIDLSSAKTIGEVAALIKNNPPSGREIYVDITAQGLIIQLDEAGGGNLAIQDVGGGTTAQELGIRQDTGSGTSVTGSALEPILRGATSLQNILGAYAGAVVHSAGSDNDIRLRADTVGETTSTGVALNGLSVTLVNDDTISAGHERVQYDPAAGTITIYIDEGRTRAYQVVNAINNAHDSGDLPFTADIDPLDDVYGGQGFVEADATALTRDGAGAALDRQSGLQITNGGETYTISLADAQTVEDVLNAINAHADLLAEINQTNNGINLRSRISGADFMVGENGGTTATQLGLRSFTENTSLDDLNHGAGVNDSEASGADGVDFTITRSDGVVLSIDITGATTIGDVIDLINNNADNADGNLTARLSVFGNGIELVDASGGTGTLTVANANSSHAATDLGLISGNSGEGTLTSAAKLISIDPITTLPVPNTAVIISAKDASDDLSGVQIVLDSTATGVTYDEITETLTVGIDPGGNTSANDVVEMINASDYSAMFYAALDPTGGNDGTGKVVDGTTATMTAASVLDGTDVNKLETTGVFAALVRLRQALQDHNTGEIERAVEILDDSTQNMNLAQAKIGALEQRLDALSNRLDTEDTELSALLSNEYDTDLTQAASDLVARQTAYEASLKATASIFQLSLFDYL